MHPPIFKHKLSTFSLTMVGISSMVGSGWLLATQKITNIAGPAGIIAWLIGMIIALILALFAIEIGTVSPSSGGIGYYSTITHGKFSGFITQWINWLSIMPVPAIEAQAIIQYLSSATNFCHSWYDTNHQLLTTSGLLVALIFMLFFMLINYWSLKLFLYFNNILTILKIAIPLLTIGFLAYQGLHLSNFGSNVTQFAPYGLKQIIVATISCGVIMSFNGFQTPLTFSEEINSPKRQLPIAIIISILLTFVLYFSLHLVFIGSLSAHDILNFKQIHFRSPYVHLLVLANLQLMAWVVMTTAVIAPTASGAAFSASSSRILYSLARSGLLPKFMNFIDKKYQSPRHAIIITTVVSCFFLLMFRGWSSLVTVISILHIFSYLSLPIVVIARRRLTKATQNKENYFHLPLAKLLAVIILFILSVLLFFASWPNTGELALLLLPGLVFFFYYELKEFHGVDLWHSLRNGIWLLYFFCGISLITYLGNNQNLTLQKISLTTSMVLLALLTITTFGLGITLINKPDEV